MAIIDSSGMRDVAKVSLPILGRRIAQVVYSENGALAVSTSVISSNDTIPQANQGGLVVEVEITPKHADSLLEIDAQVGSIDCSSDAYLVVALFKSGNVNAISTARQGRTLSNSIPASIPIKKFIVAGSTTLQKFSLRFGGDGGTVYANGKAGARLLGGSSATFISVKEHLPEGV